MDEDKTTQTVEQEVETDLKPESTTTEPERKGKTKEENFDGVVKKLNAKQQEIKDLKAKLSEYESKPKQDGDEVSAIKKQVEQLLADQMNLKMEREFEKANINPKYAKAGQALIQDIAQTHDLDLTTTEGIREATKLFAQEYPDLLTKKKDVGTPSGMNGNTSPALKSLEGDASDFFNLSKEEKAEIARQIRNKE